MSIFFKYLLCISRVDSNLTMQQFMLVFVCPAILEDMHCIREMKKMHEIYSNAEVMLACCYIIIIVGELAGKSEFVEQ